MKGLKSRIEQSRGEHQQNVILQTLGERRDLPPPPDSWTWRLRGRAGSTSGRTPGKAVTPKLRCLRHHLMLFGIISKLIALLSVTPHLFNFILSSSSVQNHLIGEIHHMHNSEAVAGNICKNIVEQFARFYKSGVLSLLHKQSKVRMTQSLNVF